MNSRIRIKTILDFGIPDKIGICDAYWLETIERWHKEGLPDDITGGGYQNELKKYFNHDIFFIDFDYSFQFEEKILKEDDISQLKINRFGVTQLEWKNKDGVPHVEDVSVKTEYDWQKYKSLLRANKTRISKDSWQMYNNYRKDNKFVAFWGLDPFEHTWRFFGFDRLLIAMFEQPKFTYDMFKTCGELWIDMLEMMLEECFLFDGVYVACDMSGRNGPLFSPRLYKKILWPIHKQMFDFCRSKKLPVILHSDGDVRPLIPFLIKAGITALQPLEVKCGIDVRELKAQYDNKICFIGNIDVREMSKSFEDIEREVKSKILPAKKNGGYIYWSDHSVPPTVSLKNYKFVLEMVEKYGRY